MTRKTSPLGLAAILAALSGVVALAALAVRSGAGDFRVGRLEEINERNFYFCPPRHLSTLIRPGESLIVRPRNISPGLLERLEFRMEIATRDDRPYRMVRTPYAKGEASWRFDETGQYVLSIGVRDTRHGGERALRKADVFVAPGIKHAGQMSSQAAADMAPSRASKMVRETAGAAILLALGISALAAFRSRLRLGWIMLIAFPAGVGIWTCLSLAVLILHVGCSGWLMGCLVGALCVAGASAAAWGGGWTFRDIRNLLLFFAGFLAAAVLLARFDFSMLMWDSWRYLIFGRRLAFFGGLEHAANYPREYGVLAALTQSMSVFLDLDFFAVLQPLLCLSTFGFVGWSLYERWREGGRSAFASAGFVVVLLACVLTAYMPAASSVWLLPNTFTGVFLLLALVVLAESISKGSRPLLALGCLFTICSSFCRIEGPIAALAILAAYFVVKRPDRDDLRLFYVPYFLAVAAWNVTIWAAFDISGGSEFLTVPKMVVMLGANAAVLAAAVACQRRQRIDRFLRSCVRLLPGFLLAVGIGVGLKDYHHAGCNLLSLAENLFAAGYWGGLWLMMLLLLPFALLAGRFRGERFFGFAILVMFLMTFDLFLFRPSWLRVHVMDSGNRMFIHYYMLLAYFIGCKLANAGEQGTQTT